MSRRFLVSLLIVLAVPACAARYTDLDRDIGQLEAAPVCCAAVAEVDFQQVEDEANFEFAIDETSPAFAFPGPIGKTFVRGFELPPITRPTRLRVRSYLMANGPFQRHGYFMPLLTLLDADRNPIAATSPDMIRHVRQNLFEGPNEADTIEVNLILAADSKIRHVLIHTATPLLRAESRAQRASTTIPVQIGKSFIPMPVEGGLIAFEGTAKGRMRLSLYDYDGPLPAPKPPEQSAPQAGPDDRPQQPQAGSGLRI